MSAMPGAPEDMVLVTDTGYELLSLFPQELIECWLPYTPY